MTRASFTSPGFAALSAEERSTMASPIATMTRVSPRMRRVFIPDRLSNDRRASAASMRDRLPEPDWRRISSCHVRCPAERKSTRASPCYGGGAAGFSAIDANPKRRRLRPERTESRFAVCERANFVPENEYEIDGEQKKFRLNSVTVFRDGINKIIRNRINEESGSEEQPPARTAGQNEKKAKPAAERNRPELPGPPPFPALIEQRSAIPEPPGAMER